MKILGCFKIVPDLDLIVEEDWNIENHLHIDTGYAKLIWNCFDEGALEMMLRLSDLSEGLNVVYKLSALTIGRQKTESFLKTLYALGFSEGARICVEEEEEILFSPEMISEGIANYVKKIEGQDVILTGIQSSDGNNKMTPYLLAEKLGWPCITQVIGLEPIDEEQLKVTSQVSGGCIVRKVKTPCVLATGNAPCSYLRIPTLKAKMKLGKRPVTRLMPEDMGMSETAESVRVTALNPINRKRNTVVIEADSPQEKARCLYEKYLKERLSEL